MLLQGLLLFHSFVEEHRPLLVLVCIVLFLAYHLVVYPLWLSPVRHIPGPYLHRVTSIPALNRQRTSRWITYVHRLHQVHGPVVVLAPNEISVNGDAKFINDIYVKNFPKSSYYAHFSHHGSPNMFGTLDNDVHLSYKRNIMGLYSKTAIFNPANSTRRMIIEKTRHLVSQVHRSSVTGQQPDYINARSEWNPHGKGHNSRPWFNLEGKSCNLGMEVYSLFGSLALDIISAFEVGNGNGTDLLLCPEKRYILMLHRMVSAMGFWTTSLPQLYNWVAGSAVLQAAKMIETWQLGIYSHAEANAPQRKLGENLTTLETFQKKGFFGKKAYSFLSDNMFAGHETTAIQLTYLFYELSRPVNAGVRKTLHNELIDNFGAPRSHDDILENLEAVDKLPFLEALLQENARIHASVPGGQPRVTNCNYPVTLENGREVVVPKGTTISCQPYSMHRVEKIFPNPEEFLPQRWLQQDNETEDQFRKRINLQQKYMMPFSRGIRMCLGMHLAIIEMKMAVGNLYWHYYSKVSSDWCEVVDKGTPIRMDHNQGLGGTDEDKMVMFEAYTTRPFNDECWLEFYEYE